MSKVQNVFLIGAKSLGAYGGYETFVYKLTEYHQNNPNIKYHVACKANGDGCMDETKLDNVKRVSDSEFEFHNARCFKIHIPQIGPAQAIYYDVAALRECCKYIKKNNIENPIVYIMACRIGPFAKHFYASYARVVLRYLDNRTIGRSELRLLSECVTTQKTNEKYNVELGAIDGTNGADVVSSIRCRTEKYDLSQQKVNVNVGNSGIKYGVFFYDAYGKYISWTGWIAGTEYAVPANASYARVVLRYDDNRNISSNELKALNNFIKISYLINESEWELPIL